VPFLRLHSWAHMVADRLSLEREASGIHPKQRIIKYKEWFLEQIPAGGVVMDVGCHEGAMVEVMSQKAGFVYGIEILESRYLTATKLRSGQNRQYVLGDATIYDYSALRPIDAITLSNVLEHIEHRVSFLKKLISRVKWGGEKKKILIRVPTIDRDWMVLYKKENGLEWRSDLTHFTEYTEESFRQEMTEAGLTVEKLEQSFGEIRAVCVA
jgi:2-polyprenyl-3-methyl-5-hydroxy-6-metoxy-1,4-benzoquinol methylase